MRGLELLRPLGAPAELATPLNYLASLARHTGAHAEALALAREGLEHSTVGQDRYGMAITATTLSQTFYAMGRYARAASWSALLALTPRPPLPERERGGRTCRPEAFAPAPLDGEGGQGGEVRALRRTMTWPYRYADARHYAEQSCAIERALGNSWGLGFNLLTLGQIARAQGEHQAARGFFQDALATRAQLRDRRGMALCLNELGDTALDLGEHAVAGWCYEQSFDLFHAIGNLWGEVAALRRLGQLARGVGQPGATARLYDEALRRARDSGSTQAIHAAEAAMAELAIGAAAPVAQATGLRQAIADVLAASATGAANTGGAPATSVAPPQPARAVGGDLTVREREVLRLVATGLTDAQVAERLVLSTRTVSSYLSTIYSKLQLRSRSAATRWAIEHGLA